MSQNGGKFPYLYTLSLWRDRDWSQILPRRRSAIPRPHLVAVCAHTATLRFANPDADEAIHLLSAQ